MKEQVVTVKESEGDRFSFARLGLYVDFKYLDDHKKSK